MTQRREPADFGAWWADRDRRAVEHLDALAQDAADDPDALSLLLTLLDRHDIARPALHRLLVDPHDLDDAEQAALANFAMKIATFDGRSRFTTWLHVIAENEAKMLIRGRERRPSTPTAELEPAPFFARLSTLVADRDVVDRALSTLPTEYRRVLELREIDRFEYDEIAETLRIPVGTVRSRLHRARALLVNALG